MLIKAAAVCVDVAITAYADRLLAGGFCHSSFSTGIIVVVVVCGRM